MTEHTTETIWNAFCCVLKSFIIKRISDPSLADDILQEVFIKIHEKIDTLKDKTKIQSWVYQITRNTIVDYYRKQKMKLEDIEEFSDQVTDEMPEDIPARDIADSLKAMVEKLPDKYAHALLLVEFQGIAQKDLAKKLGISVSGAKSRVQRGRELLKDSLMCCVHYEFDRYGTIIDAHPVTCCCCHRYKEN
jgi:RNA polymerase sigma-70 factor (ECF subfamily)